MTPTQAHAVGSGHERPVFIPYRDSHMFGVLTTPFSPARRMGVLFANGAGVVPCCGRNQFWTKLARELGKAGFHVLRFDYPGAGDSPGIMPSPDFENPLADEVAAAYQWLGEQEVDGSVVIGKCFGGRNAVYALPRLSGLRGLAMLSTPVTPEMKVENRLRNTSLGELFKRATRGENLRRYLGRKRRRYARAAARRIRTSLEATRVTLSSTPTDELQDPAMEFFARLDPTLASRGRIFVLHGTDDAYFADVESEAREGHLASLVQRYDERQLRVEFIEGRVHGFGRIAMQDHIKDLLRSWVTDVADAHRGDT